MLRNSLNNYLFRSSQFLIRSLSKDSNAKGKEESYVQGQHHKDGKFKEYFYHLNNHGRLFLDDTPIKELDSSYKEQGFLQHFFKNLRKNISNRYAKNFPFVSHNEHEKEYNYLRCDDLPFIITKLDENIHQIMQLNHINSAHWSFHFEPKNLYYDKKNGRLYYVFDSMEIIDRTNHKLIHKDSTQMDHLDSLPCKIALVNSEISIYLLKKMDHLKEDESLDNAKVDEEASSDNLKINYKQKVFKPDSSTTKISLFSLYEFGNDKNKEETKQTTHGNDSVELKSKADELLKKYSQLTTNKPHSSSSGSGFTH